MKRIAFCFLLFAAGCNNLHKLPGFGEEKRPEDNSPRGDLVTYTGTTVFDNQIIQPVRTINCAILVRVKRPGEDWVECNKYEIRIDTVGPGGGAVWLLGKVDISGGWIVPRHKPVAPVGTQYEIASLLEKED